MEKQGFKWRSFVSFGMFFSFLIMGISGLILYIAPPGRVFRWTDWHLLWINLDQWQALHTLFSYLFLGFAVSHIFWMNWKVLFTYFTRKTKAGLRRKRELISSSLIVLLIVIATLFKIPPFQSIMDLGSWASETWGENVAYPPVSHAEEMTIAEMATVILDITPEAYIQRIKAAGYNIADQHVTFEVLCQQNNISPYVLFQETTDGLNIKSIPAQ